MFSVNRRLRSSAISTSPAPVKPISLSSKRHPAPPNTDPTCDFCVAALLYSGKVLLYLHVVNTNRCLGS